MLYVYSTTQQERSSWLSKLRNQYAVVSRSAFDSISSTTGIKILRFAMHEYVDKE